MSDSMKFGPEWLRNMSNDIGNLSSASTAIGSSGGGGGGGGGTAGSNYSNNNSNNNNNNSSRFPQAEFRYGREEMLSLHDKNFKLPELLPKYHKLFIEKMQCPLALLPPSSDEEVPRGLSTIGALSSERGAGLGLSASSSSSGLMGSISSSLSGMSARGTRGSSIDRGRGRARGGLYHSTLGNYQRSALYDEENRSLTGRSERAWPERNGTAATDTEWTSTSAINPSPRKEFSSLRSNASGESWRRSRIEDDELGTNVNGEGWRTSGANNSMYKWPIRSTSWRGGEGEGGSAFNSDLTGPSPGRLERSKSSNSGIGLSSRDHDSLSAATNLNRRFGAGNNNTPWDDEIPEWAMDEPIEGGGSFDASGAFLGCDDKHLRGHYDGSNEDELHNSDEMRRHDREDSPSEATDDKHGDDLTRSTNSDDGIARHSPDENDKNESNTPNFSNAKEAPNEKTNRINESGSGDKGNSADQKSERTIPSVSPSTADVSGGSSRVAAHNDRMREVADDIEKLIMDDDLSCSDNVSLQSDSKAHKSSADECVADKVGENALNVGAASASELSDLWYYRDPQGKVQGPFTATEMLEWYRAGYFDENLYVKRVCDPQFMALGELLKLCSGTIPFVAAPYMPQLLQANKGNDIIVAPAAAPTKPVANHISHATLPNQPVLENPLMDEPIHRIHPMVGMFVGSQNGSPQKFPQLEQPHLLNQQAMAIKSLAETEPWALLNPEQQATLMAINNAQPILSRGGDDRITDDRRQGPVPVNMIHQAADPVQQAAMLAIHNAQPAMLKDRNKTDVLLKDRNKAPMEHSQYNPIKSLIMQLSMPKSAPPPNMLPALHHLQQPSHMQLAHENRMPPIPQAHNVHGLWEIPLPLASSVAPNERIMLQQQQEHLADEQRLLLQQQQQQQQQQQHQEHLADFSSSSNCMNREAYARNLPVTAKHIREKYCGNLDYSVTPGNYSVMHGNYPAKEPQHLQTPMMHHELQQSMPSELLQQSEMFKIRNENFKEELIVTETDKVAVVDKNIAKNPKSDAKFIQSQSSFLVNDSDVRNNNPMVAGQSIDKLKLDEDNQLIDAKSNKFNKNVPATAATASKPAPLEIKQNQKVALNNNNTQQQQQNGTHESGLCNFPSISNNNASSKAIASVAVVGPAVGGKTAAAPAKENSTKKKSKDKNQPAEVRFDNGLNQNGVKKPVLANKAAVKNEFLKRQQEEEERESLEEKKRLEAIAAQRKAKLVDQNAAAGSRADANGKRNNSAASVAPWSNITEVAATTVVNSPLNFAEIQKAERERRAEMYRLEQSLREQQTQAILEQQQQKDAVLKWKLKPQANQTKSLAEIQAEESKARQSNIQQVSTTNAQMKSQSVKKDEKWSAASQWAMRGDFSWGESAANVGSSMLIVPGNGSVNCFWEEGTKPVASAPYTKSQSERETRPSSIVQQPSASSTANSSNSKSAQPTKATALAKTNSSGNVPIANASNNNAATVAKKAKATTSKKANNAQNEDSNNDDFHNWCTKTLSAKHGDVIDVPTFVSFLRDIESAFEVKDYIRMYLGETKECVEFAKNFLERRSRYNNQQRAANAHIDDMCSPAPAITPAADGQETKGKGKKEKKKNKMMKLDSRILGFSVTSAEDRLNVGARDYARDGP